MIMSDNVDFCDFFKFVDSMYGDVIGDDGLVEYEIVFVWD